MNISHPVSPLRQPNLNDCWATCLAMVLGLHGPLAVAEIKRRAAGIPLKPDGSLAPSSVPRLAAMLNLRLTNMLHPLQELSRDNLSVAMRSSCAAAFGEYNYPGAPLARKHVLLFYRLAGADNNPMAYCIEPYTGRRIHYLISEINQELGSVDYFISR